MKYDGGRGGSGGCAGDDNGFGGTFDADEFVGCGEDRRPCLSCSDGETPRPVWQSGWGTLFRDKFLHRDGCNKSL